MRYFVTVTETGSFTTASKQLGIAQPAISMAINKLEKELGAELINRSKRKFELTYAGEIFLNHCINILNSTDNAITEINEINDLDKGVIKFAAPITFGDQCLVDIISDYQKQHPNIIVDISTGSSSELLQMLLNNEHDFVIVDERDVKNGVESMPIYEDDIRVWMSKDHPLANSQHLPLKILAQHRMGITKDSLIARKFLEKIRSIKNIEPNIVTSTNLQRLLFKSMLENEVITVMGKNTLSNTQGLVAVPIEGGPYPFKLSAAWKKGRYLSKATKEFLDFARDQLTAQANK